MSQVRSLSAAPTSKQHMSNFYEIQRLKYGEGWSGSYSSWEEAEKQSIGYSDPKIVEQVKSALLSTKDKSDRYEIDGCIRQGKPQSAFDLLYWIKESAVNGHINIVDFGGSLGTVFYQLRPYLKDYTVRWNIIEQDNFVKIGRDTFQNENLKFYHTIEECFTETKPNCFLASGSLTYIPKPYEVIQSLKSYNFDWIILARTSIVTEDTDKLTIQIVPPQIYKAIYPCWFFSQSKLVKAVTQMGFKHSVVFSGSASFLKGYVFQKE